MTQETSFSTIRREYGTQVLSEHSMRADPMEQFQTWFDEIVLDEIEPTAMSLATVDDGGMPDVRIVLLKGIEQGNFVFYTHYDSQKGQEIANNNKVALNFFWSKYIRQVRVRGEVQKTTSENSDAYFASRPLLSQLSAVASHQSQPIMDRKSLEEQVGMLAEKYKNSSIPRPKEWGGYVVKPYAIEFWQGRDNRLHDRVRYIKKNTHWIIERLAP
jgi:pyridoxamine 5'-phosphate oxidase